MKSYSSKTSLYNQVPRVNHPRSTFKRPQNLKTTFNSSVVRPIYCQPVLPGDTVDLQMHNFVRMMPLVQPIMDNIYVDVHFFFCPTRIVWDNFPKFMGEQKNPGDSTDFLVPVTTSPASTGYQVGTLGEAFGIRQGVPNITHSSIPLRMYNLIWNEWFRDQMLQQSAPVPTGDGPDNITDFILRPYNKFHDYFTSALPAPQRGPSVMIPSVSQIPVTGLYAYGTAGTSGAAWDTKGNAAAGNSATVSLSARTQATGAVSATNLPVITADLSSNTVATINALRQAEAIQTLFERDARGGTRYAESNLVHFGVRSSDARLQRPEYLGGNSVPVNITPVLQTSETGSTPQGNMAANGVLSSSNASFIKSFEEHGYIIGVVCARSDIHYQQGTDRDWFKRTRLEHYVPALANIGEQAILKEEIYTQGTPVDKEVFGYIPRWDEYRYATSRITGALNSDTPASLDIWHLAQDYNAVPALNDSFVKDGTPEGRVLAVPTEPAFIGDFQFDQRWTRVMPMYSIPGMGSRL
ncbi:major capsid protein [Apis mellifera associated microvirus 30]|nr:major capsid protein [Apis mellifera associated microvirus 30]